MARLVRQRFSRCPDRAGMLEPYTYLISDVCIFACKQREHQALTTLCAGCNRPRVSTISRACCCSNG